jgi:catechol 2,3-dioxygenase-like lactoylglutathione lyase family enzyme
MTFTVDRIDHVVLNCRDTEATIDWYVRVLNMRREEFDAGAAEVGAHLRDCGVQVTEGPVAKTGALGPMTSHYCRDPEGNLVEVATYNID